MNAPRICDHCGRTYEHRGNPEQRFCSTSCRRSQSAAIHGELEGMVLAALAVRDWHTTICPSEVARERFGDDFRQHMETVRRAARRLAHRGEVIITQKGNTVDPANFRGPIRIGRGPQYRLAQAPPVTNPGQRRI